jgi:hypothetical protein
MPMRARCETLASRLRTRLGGEELERALTAGARLSLEEGIERALAELRPAGDKRDAPFRRLYTGRPLNSCRELR